MTTDTEDLRVLLDAATQIRRSLPGELHGGHNAEYTEVFIENAIAHHAPGETDDPDLRRIWEADAAVFVAAVNALPDLLDRLEAAEADAREARAREAVLVERLGNVEALADDLCDFHGGHGDYLSAGKSLRAALGSDQGGEG